MHKYAETEIWVPYSARIRLPGRRGTVKAVRFAAETFAIRRVPAPDAPVALEASFGPGADGSLRWRDFEGSYWRPVVTDGPTAAQPRGSSGWNVRPDERRAIVDWADYPFPGWRPINGRSPHDPVIGVVVDHDREARVRVAHDIAAGLVMVGGVLHKRAPLPAWRINDLKDAKPGTPRLSLVLPDLLPASGALVPSDAWFARLETVCTVGLGLHPVADFDGAARLASFIQVGSPGRPNLTAPSTGVEVREPLRGCTATSLGMLRLHQAVWESLRPHDPWDLGEDVAVAADAAADAAIALEAGIARASVNPHWAVTGLDPDRPTAEASRRFQALDDACGPPPAMGDATLGPQIRILRNALQRLCGLAEENLEPDDVDTRLLYAADALAMTSETGWKRQFDAYHRTFPDAGLGGTAPTM
ncbi:hypothetical protein [Methylobacterium oryzae]|uniref:Uncharacterized protein n=1 Tax=Methylobacterium oryzae TaxID=334852 RepID=A0ABU7TM21_9HYPH